MVADKINTIADTKELIAHSLNIKPCTINELKKRDFLRFTSS